MLWMASSSSAESRLRDLTELGDRDEERLAEAGW
ncbi:uncharacterized protein FIBRA_07645 [Fibroporia radiculosa]|uniref:Uncharacterized protein n=1 Tax=Fibroporia radiculosa TaxID=599839 RepID=J4GF70_9APHY|nr:uncharacterized protein FIBRA_07645 [Fibroporia radiculosa]CCM05428.1 predicted protein [Fibroporia radiculosa]